MADIEIGSLVLLAVALSATGVIAGIIAGLLGVGGGIVIVPVLYHMLLALGVDKSVVMHVAVGTSLATILGTGTSSALAHYRRGSVDLDLLKRWWLPIAVGVITGTIIGGNVSGTVLSLIFATVALAVAVNMTFRKDGIALAGSLPGTPLKELLGLLIGSISVMMGIGGGTLSVPILTLFSYPIRLAVGTASAIGLIIAVSGNHGRALLWLGRRRPAGLFARLYQPGRLPAHHPDLDAGSPLGGAHRAYNQPESVEDRLRRLPRFHRLAHVLRRAALGTRIVESRNAFCQIAGSSAI